MARFSLWSVVFELDDRRSLRIFWNRNARRVLLGVDVSIGKKHCSRLFSDQFTVLCGGSGACTHVLESMTSFFLKRTKLPTIFSLSSGSRVA
jgi:hypothetical protein